MAQPTGSCTVADFGYAVTWEYSTYENDYEFLYCVLPLAYMPTHWQTDGTIDHYMPHDLIHNVFIDVEAGDSCRVMIDAGPRSVTDYDGAIDAWQTDQVISSAEIQPFKRQPDFLGANKERNQYVVVEIGLAKSAAEDVAEVDGFGWQAGNDVGYGSADPSGARKVELTNRDTVAKRLYTEYRSLSSWHAQRMLAHTLNKLMNAARYTTSVPVYGGYAA